MYLSLVTPSEERTVAAAFRRMGEAYLEHQWLWKFFDSHPDQKRDFLYARRGSDASLRYYLLSERRPALFSPDWDIETRVFQPRIVTSQRYAFSLHANPVISRRDANGRQVRFGITTDLVKRAGKALTSEQRDQGVLGWLARKGAQSGFSILHAQVDTCDRVDAGKKSIFLSTVDFSGHLQVDDASAFEKALLQGIGPAKAFGCGLLLIKPVQGMED